MIRRPLPDDPGPEPEEFYDPDPPGFDDWANEREPWDATSTAMLLGVVGLVIGLAILITWAVS